MEDPWAAYGAVLEEDRESEEGGCCGCSTAAFLMLLAIALAVQFTRRDQR